MAAGRRAVATLATLAALLATAATAQASPLSRAASAARPATLTLPSGPVSVLTRATVDRLIEEVPLGASGISLSALEAPALARLVYELPGIASFEKVPGLGKRAGVEAAIEAAIAELVSEGEELEELVGSNGFAIDVEEQLEATYESSAVGKKAGAPEFEEAVESALGREPEEVIDEGLESLTLSELLSRLLGVASHPATLLADVFADTEAEALEELLETTLTDAPFTQSTVAEVAGALGESASHLAEQLGDSGELPEASAAFTATLGNGGVLAVFAGHSGLVFARIGATPPSEPPPEPPASTGEAPPTAPASHPPVVPATPTSTATAAPTPPTAVPAAPGNPRIRILSHGLSGHLLRLVIDVPAAGQLTLRGQGVKPFSHTFAAAARVSRTLALSRAGAASLHKHHHLNISVLATFTPATGAPSSTRITAVLR